MKQTIHMCVKKMLSCIVVLSVIIAMGMLASCSSNDNPSNGGSTSEKADLVVYGKIFTSESNKVLGWATMVPSSSKFSSLKGTNSK